MDYTGDLQAGTNKVVGDEKEALRSPGCGMLRRKKDRGPRYDVETPIRYVLPSPTIREESADNLITLWP
jgi:hypothetical protein